MMSLQKENNSSLQQLQVASTFSQDSLWTHWPHDSEFIVPSVTGQKEGLKKYLLSSTYF